MPDKDVAIKIVASNRRASFDYELGERFEAGIALTGGEIKSLRMGKADLRDAFVLVRGGEAWLINATITPYVFSKGFDAGADPLRERRLLLHKKEIGEIDEEVSRKGYTAVVTKMYLKRGRAKLEVALARGKKNYDKRAATAKRDAQREIDRALKERD